MVAVICTSNRTTVELVTLAFLLVNLVLACSLWVAKEGRGERREGGGRGEKFEGYIQHPRSKTSSSQ